MNKLQEKQAAFLISEISYRNSNNRAINSNDRCLYSHEFHGGCAIGRKIPQELCLILDGLSESSVDCNEVFEQLPEELQELTQDFLTDMQHLHDFRGKAMSFTEQGLSLCGKDRVKHMIQKYGLEGLDSFLN